jgi:protein-disulfide isomerase
MLKVPVTSGDHVRGPKNAPVTLVEYGDYECPTCSAAHPIVNLVREHFGRKLRFVFRHFPLAAMHPHAESAAETAEFGGSHGQFWEMHDALFENQDQLGSQLYFFLADALQLSAAELQQALAAHAFAAKVRADFLGGVRSGVNGTPTFFINGVRHDGSWAFGDLVTAIDAQLHHSRASP